MAIAARAGHDEVAEAVRSAAPDEAAVFAAIARTVTGESRTDLLEEGLFNAVVDHASAGVGALKHTGQALVVMTSEEATTMLQRRRAFVAGASVSRLEAKAGFGGGVAGAMGRALSASPGVHELLLDGGADDEADVGSMLRHVLVSPWLACLELRACALDDGAARWLASALRAGGGLTSLAMDRCEIDAEGASAIVRAAGESDVLERLEMTGVHVIPDGGDALGGMLAATRSLTSAKLSGSGAEAGWVVGLARGLAANASLTELVLGGAWPGAEGAAALSEALTVNSTLHALEVGLAEEEAPLLCLCGRLAGWRGLRRLRLVGSVRGDSGGLALGGALQRNTCLTKVELRLSGAGADGAASIAAALGSKGGALSDLSIGLCNGAPTCAEALMAAMRGAREGAVLRLPGNELRAEDGAAVAAGLPSCLGLRGLSLNGARMPLGCEGALGEAMVRAPWLTELALQSMPMADAGVEALARGIAACTGLTSLQIDSCVHGAVWVERVVSALERLPALERLRLSGHDMSTSAARLGHILPRWRDSLTELDLNACLIDAAGMADLAAGVAACSRLQRLDVSQNPLGDGGATALAGAVSGLSRLTALGRSGCEEGHRGVVALAEALHRLPRLREVDRGPCCQTDAAWEVAACRRRHEDRRRRRWLARRRLVLWRPASRE